MWDMMSTLGVWHHTRQDLPLRHRLRRPIDTIVLMGISLWPTITFLRNHLNRIMERSSWAIQCLFKDLDYLQDHPIGPILLPSMQRILGTMPIFSNSSNNKIHSQSRQSDVDFDTLSHSKIDYDYPCPGRSYPPVQINTPHVLSRRHRDDNLWTLHANERPS